MQFRVRRKTTSLVLALAALMGFAGFLAVSDTATSYTFYPQKAAAGENSSRYQVLAWSSEEPGSGEPAVVAETQAIKPGFASKATGFFKWLNPWPHVKGWFAGHRTPEPAPEAEGSTLVLDEGVLRSDADSFQPAQQPQPTKPSLTARATGFFKWLNPWPHVKGWLTPDRLAAPALPTQDAVFGEQTSALVSDTNQLVATPQPVKRSFFADVIGFFKWLNPWPHIKLWFVPTAKAPEANQAAQAPESEPQPPVASEQGPTAPSSVPQVRGPNPAPEHSAQAQPARANTSVSGKSAAAPTSTLNIAATIEDILNRWLAEGRLTGPQGPQGPPGQAGPTVPGVSMFIPASPAYSNSGGIQGAFRYLSGDETVTRQITVSGTALLQGGLTVQGGSTLATTTISSLNISTGSTMQGALTVSGSAALQGGASVTGALAQSGGAARLASTTVTGTFAVQDSSSASRLHVNSTGGVGINTSTPAEALDVNGRLYLEATTAPAALSSRLYNLAGDLYWNGALLNGTGGALPGAGAAGNVLLSNGTSWTSTGLIGDASVNGSGVITFKNTGTAGSYGSASSVPVFTTDAQGRVTGATTTAIALNASQLTSGTLTVAQGGMGTTSLTGILKGNGNSAVTAIQGTAGYVSRWTDGSTLGTGTLYDNGTSVGIGTTSPSGNLDVYNSINGVTAIRIHNPNTGSGAYAEFSMGNDTNARGFIIDLNGANAAAPFANSVQLGNMENGPMYFYAGGGSVSNIAQTILASGKIGIGTTTPTQLLAVAGNMQLSGALFDTNSASGTVGMILQSTSSGTQWVATSTLGITGGSGTPGGSSYTLQYNNAGSFGGVATLLTDGTLVGYNATSPTVSFNIQGTSGSANTIFNVASSSGSSILAVLPNGNVGIGTTSPSQLLTVGNNNQFTVTAAGSVTAATMTLSSLTQGSIPFVGAGGLLTQDNANLFWNAGQHRLGINTGASPNEVLQVNGCAGCGSSGSDNTSIRIQGISTGYTNINMFDAQVGGANFGIYNGYPAAGYFTIRENGVANRLVIAKTTGNIGIGTSSPAAQLDVYGNGNTDPFNVSSSSNISLFHITAAGNVGIGTASPNTLLQVNGGTGATDALHVTNNTTGYTFVGYDGQNNRGRIGAYNGGWQNLIINEGGGNVGIGGSSPAATLAVTGSGAVNPLTIASSSGVAMLNLQANGNFTVGTPLISSNFNSFDINTATAKNFLLCKDPANTQTCTVALAEYSTTNNAFSGGLYAQGTAVNSTGTMPFLYGVYGETDSFATSTGAVNVMSGLADTSENHGNTATYNAGATVHILTDAGATSSNAIGYFVRQMTNTGSVTNAYAFYSVDIAGATNNYGIYTNAGWNHFGDVASFQVPGYTVAKPANAVEVQGGSGTGLVSLGQVSDANTFGCINFVNTGCAIANYNIAGNGTDLRLNSPAGAVILAYNNAEGMRLDSTGRVGVNSTTPGSTLAITGLAGNINPFTVASSSGSQLLTVLPSGYVGIGTTTPGSPLVVEGNQGFTNGVFYVQNDSGAGNNIFTVASPNLGVGNETYMNLGVANSVNNWISQGFYYAGNGSASNRMDYQFAFATSPIMSLVASGNIGIGQTGPVSKLDVNGGVTVGASYSGVNGAPANGMIIQGNVGIGTASPSEALEVYSANTATYNARWGAALMKLNMNVANGGPALSLVGNTQEWRLGIWGADADEFMLFDNTHSTVPIKVYPGAASNALVISASGNVGIGTSTPGATLHVQAASGVIPLKIASSTGAGLLTLDASGNLTIKGSLTQNGSPDVAENVVASDPSVTAGDVVALDASYSPSASTTEAYDTFAVIKATSTSAVLGVISTRPGILINATPENATSEQLRPLVLAGRVPVKVTNENGNIKRGDFLAASRAFSGYAMKATGAGWILGRALEAFSSNVRDDSGTVLVLVQPGDSTPKVADFLQFGTLSTPDPWFQSLAAQNLAQASVFESLAVTDTLAVQKDLRVQGIVYAAEIRTDTLIAKTLCLEDVCISKTQLQQLLQLVNPQAGTPTATSSTSSPATGLQSAADAASSSSSAALPALDASTGSSPAGAADAASGSAALPSVAPSDPASTPTAPPTPAVETAPPAQTNP